MRKKNYILLFARFKGNIRLINTMQKRGEAYLLRVQIQKSFLGITYWKTLDEFDNFDEAMRFYTMLVDGYCQKYYYLDKRTKKERLDRRPQQRF